MPGTVHIGTRATITMQLSQRCTAGNINITRMKTIYWLLLVRIVNRSSLVSSSSATDSQVFVVKSSSLKALNGEEVCAVDAASSSSFAKSKLDCVQRCASSDVWPCTGVNYRSNVKRCELFAELPMNYTVQKDCEHLQVSLNKLRFADIYLMLVTNYSC
jgi:hypothetical protein